MPEAHGTVRVAEIPGEPFRYRVESWTTPETFHTVDIIANHGVGECSCEFWRFTCWPNMKANGFKAIPYETKNAQGERIDTLCRHVTVARFYQQNHMLFALWQGHGRREYNEG